MGMDNIPFDKLKRIKEENLILLFDYPHAVKTQDLVLAELLLREVEEV